MDSGNLTLIRGSLPGNLKPGAVERALEAFCLELPPKGDKVGFFNQTIASIHSAIYQNQGDFWLALGEGGEVDAYLLGHVNRDIDNRLTYWLSQAWASPKIRGTYEVKQMWQTIRQKARDYLCAHIVVVSGRDNNEVYCRFLGNFHIYATLLKEDL